MENEVEVPAYVSNADMKDRLAAIRDGFDLDEITGKSESTDRTQAIPAVACKCTDPDYCDTRTVDSFRLGVLWKLTEQPFQEGVCGPESTPCPACPDSPWLVLACILLPGNNAVITAAMIDNDIRTAL
jgi:hypothetical protein